MRMPKHLGPFHIVGLGGIGMSAIAHVMLRLGYKVQGSDLSDSPNLRRLGELGAITFVGHAASNIDNAGCVIISTAVKPGNPERDEALKRGIPVIIRADSADRADAPLRHHQCIWNAWQNHHLLADCPCPCRRQYRPDSDQPAALSMTGPPMRALARESGMVVEADESDGTFLKLPSQVGIISNIDPEHLDHYGDFRHAERGVHHLCQQYPVLWIGRCGDR